MAVKASQGRYFFTPAWGNHAGDNLSSARGATQMLADIAVDSGWVRYALKEVSDYQIEVYEMLWERVEPIGLEGSVNYVRCWSPGRTAGFDCDVSCMIGVKDFQEIFLPPLVETMLTADHRLYHLDGPGALHHVDTLLAVPELHVIQWVPGHLNESIAQWTSLLRRILRSGKGVIANIKPHEVEPLLDELDPNGLFIQTHCKSEDEARRLTDRVAERF